MPSPRTSIWPASAAPGGPAGGRAPLRRERGRRRPAARTAARRRPPLAAAPARAATCRIPTGLESARRARRPARRKRGWSASPSHRRQAHHEARAENLRRLACRGRDAGAVLGPDASAVRLDDLLGDRQAEPGVLPEALVRPVGVEALEDLSNASGRMPGPSSSTMISTSLRCRRQVTRTVPPGGENERAFSIRLSNTWPSRESWPDTTKASGPPPSNVSDTVASSAWRTSLRTPATVLSSFDEIDRRHVVALQFGVEPAGVGNVGDQPVEPLHVVLDHREQPRLALRRLGERQRLDRGAQRGQRVLQLVRDVGGEALDRLDPAVERVGHVAQRARQMADLVAPRW